MLYGRMTCRLAQGRSSQLRLRTKWRELRSRSGNGFWWVAREYCEIPRYFGIDTIYWKEFRIFSRTCTYVHTCKQVPRYFGRWIPLYIVAFRPSI